MMTGIRGSWVLDDQHRTGMVAEVPTSLLCLRDAGRY